jgi:hypothetical protein
VGVPREFIKLCLIYWLVVWEPICSSFNLCKTKELSVECDIFFFKFLRTTLMCESIFKKHQILTCVISCFIFNYIFFALLSFGIHFHFKNNKKLANKILIEFVFYKAVFPFFFTSICITFHFTMVLYPYTHGFTQNIIFDRNKTIINLVAETNFKMF